MTNCNDFRSARTQVLHRVALFLEFVDGGVDLGLAEAIDGDGALLHGADEVTLEALDVRDDVGHRAALDSGIGEVRILAGGVVAPDAEVGDFRAMAAGLGGELAFRAVFIDARLAASVTTASTSCTPAP